jgi:hypothetical protein
MSRAVLATLAACCVVAASASAAGRQVSCARFVVGRANSTAYPRGELPARGVARGVPCKTLRRVARRLNDGTYPIPQGASARAPRYGRPFAVRDRGLTWTCRLQTIGGSGPTYAVKCSHRSARMRWRTG